MGRSVDRAIYVPPCDFPIPLYERAHGLTGDRGRTMQEKKKKGGYHSAIPQLRATRANYMHNRRRHAQKRRRQERRCITRIRWPAHPENQEEQPQTQQIQE